MGQGYPAVPEVSGSRKKGRCGRRNRCRTLTIRTRRAHNETLRARSSLHTRGAGMNCIEGRAAWRVRTFEIEHAHEMSLARDLTLCGALHAGSYCLLFSGIYWHRRIRWRFCLR